MPGLHACHPQPQACCPSGACPVLTTGGALAFSPQSGTLLRDFVGGHNDSAPLASAAALRSTPLCAPHHTGTLCASCTDNASPRRGGCVPCAGANAALVLVVELLCIAVASVLLFRPRGSRPWVPLLTDFVQLAAVVQAVVPGTVLDRLDFDLSLLYLDVHGVSSTSCVVPFSAASSAAAGVLLPAAIAVHVVVLWAAVASWRACKHKADVKRLLPHTHVVVAASPGGRTPAEAGAAAVAVSSRTPRRLRNSNNEPLPPGAASPPPLAPPGIVLAPREAKRLGPSPSPSPRDAKPAPHTETGRLLPAAHSGSPRDPPSSSTNLLAVTLRAAADPVPVTEAQARHSRARKSTAAQQGWATALAELPNSMSPSTGVTLAAALWRLARLSYVAVTFTSLALLHCRDVGGVRVLHTHPALACSSSTHWPLLVAFVAVPGLLLVTIGVPVSAVVCARRTSARHVHWPLRPKLFAGMMARRAAFVLVVVFAVEYWVEQQVLFFLLASGTFAAATSVNPLPTRSGNTAASVLTGVLLTVAMLEVYRVGEIGHLVTRGADAAASGSTTSMWAAGVNFATTAAAVVCLAVCCVRVHKTV